MTVTMLLLAVCAACAPGAEEPRPDNRPYEFINADRTADEVAPWIDFEEEGGWRGEAEAGGVARVARSQERQLFGEWTLAVTLKCAEGRVRPPYPLTLPTRNFDRMGFWLRGTCPDYGFPRRALPTLDVVFRLADGSRRVISITDECRGGDVRWSEWFYVVRRFADEDLADLRQPGVAFDGFTFNGCTNAVEKTFYFDNIAFFRDSTAPLAYAPHVDDLPFPTRADGALPDSAAAGSRNAVTTNGSEVVLTYEGSDGRLTYRWPLGADPDSILASWNGQPPFRPMAGGGVQGGAAAYGVSIRGKTLVIDVAAPTGTTAVVFGRADRITKDFLVPMYYDGWESRRSRIALTDGVFSHAFADWYRSGASEIGKVIVGASSVTNRAAIYNPKTDGRYNPVSERIYLTVSPELLEVLPVVANPPSPLKHVTGGKAFNSYASTKDRARDKRFWRGLWRLGIRDVIVTDHEICFRDGGESFTFRLDAAPAKGGDEGLRDWSDFLRNGLGYRYGLYNNFTDLATINACWRMDRAGRNPDGSLTRAWMRCYSPKSAYAVEANAWLAPRLKEKFGFDAAYCDVHTAVLPWQRTDYDARVPGAGRFTEVYYNYGKLLLDQRRFWNGPVYSEGTCQFMYAGLTDGNFAQACMDAEKDPWIVDFNLTRIHPLQCDFGMGLVYHLTTGNRPKEVSTLADWFLSATLAFGHAAYLMTDFVWQRGGQHGPCHREGLPDAYERGLPLLLNSYYLTLPLAKRYTLAEATAIRYAAADGRLVGVSEAIRTDAADRHQIAVSYSDGTVIVANGSLTERMAVTVEGRRVDLPPTGFAGWTKDGAVDMLSSDAGGARADYCASPDSIYLNTRTAGFRTFAKARGEGIAICRREADGAWELIPVRGKGFAFAVPGTTAVALAEDGHELGAAEVVRDGDFASVTPVEGAYSYRLR